MSELSSENFDVNVVRVLIDRVAVMGFVSVMRVNVCMCGFPVRLSRQDGEGGGERVMRGVRDAFVCDMQG